MQERLTRCIILGLASVIVLASLAHAQTVLHVDAGSPNDGPGNDWEHAYHYLQDALTAAASPGYEIRVTGGIHYPDESTVDPNGTDDRTAIFQLENGVGICGGYRGCTAGVCGGDADDRDLALYETILSGDLGGNDVAGEFPGGPSFADNSFHVVTGSGTDATAILDGVTITAGYANGGTWDDLGAGVNIESGSPKLVNCRLIANATVRGGAGMYARTNSGPAVIGCVFSGNSGGDLGGGIHTFQYSTPTVINSVFIRNQALWGGAIQNHTNCNPILTNGILWGNSAPSGPEIHNDATSASGDTCSCVQDADPTDASVYPGAGNTDAVPLFVDALGSDVDLHLQSGSPCINTGDNAAVPDDLLTDIDEALADNEVVVGPGTYVERINLQGKAITLRSANGPEVTIIDGDAGGSVIACTSGEGPNTVIEGFKVKNGNASVGGGVHIVGSSPAVSKCQFVGNTATLVGGGMYGSLASPTLTNCTFSGNSAGISGGGVYNGSISSPTLSNCVLWDNAAPTGAAIHDTGRSISTVTYTCIEGGWPGDGNVIGDPAFQRAPNHGGDGWGDDPGTPDVDEGANDDFGNLRLSPGSPAIDAGDPGFAPARRGRFVRVASVQPFHVVSIRAPAKGAILADDDHRRAEPFQSAPPRRGRCKMMITDKAKA